jgi:thymidine phosphorylase
MIASGQARDTFRRVVQQQGGDASVVDDPSRLPRARHTETVRSKQNGFVAQIACERVGVASLILGGGREKQDDAIDPAVGIVLEKKIGDAVKSGDALCTVRYNADARLKEATAMLEDSFVIREQAPPRTPLVRKVVGA